MELVVLTVMLFTPSIGEWGEYGQPEITVFNNMETCETFVAEGSTDYRKRIVDDLRSAGVLQDDCNADCSSIELSCTKINY